ncbi:MAG: UDP-N-acetylmuramoyl-tripeptide--D-alanyl-D-alanine ligase [Cyclobacteriaceae bacterium]
MEALYQKYLSSGKVSTDTRNIPEGAIFFALKGPSFNANQFALEALDKGAAFAVIDEEAYQKDERMVLVKDVLRTLQELAQYHRQKLKIPIIGLTGSNGKTTTKELIREVLSPKYKVLATKGNLNNHIGVPLTLLSIHPEVEIAVIEMGANHIGEIAQLCEIAQPTHGLITNIGKAHIEGFGGFEGVIRGKSELYHYLIQNGGEVFINSQDEILNNMAKRFDKPYFYPGPEDYLTCTLIDADPFVTYKNESGVLVKTQLVGAYNFSNIAAALCLGKFFDIPEEEADGAIAQYVPANNRSQVIQKGSNTIILDAYNANPNSMEAALENLKAMKAGYKVVILGDMFELGADSEFEHERIAALAESSAFGSVLLCGALFSKVKNENSRAQYFGEKQGLINYLKEVTLKDSAILLKGSRGMGLEEVLESINN